MEHSGLPAVRSRRLTWRATVLGGAVTAAAVAIAAFAPSASAAQVDVKYGGCTSSNPGLAAAPPDYTTKVTLTPQGSDFKTGQAIRITWHYSTSTAPGPVGIPVANVATAKAKILVAGAASSTITTADSAKFPPSPVAAGGTFQIPDMTATFTPTAAGTYTLTPGDNEQDVAQFGVVVNCKASGATAAATITVAAGTGGTTSTSTATSATTTAATATTSTSTLSTLPHTGFDGRWLFGGAGLAAVLGGAGIAATRRRRGSHG
ncbi:LPXTG cell wall anchor domain-containing protein [Catenulispora subtropica]|uniref:LPXTG-motif cell wall anchor domain protein n=1 Tax=Catenulispora subtropica TaxID=450798 RepID=A0ABN2RWH4_9ACTN